MPWPTLVTLLVCVAGTALYLEAELAMPQGGRFVRAGGALACGLSILAFLRPDPLLYPLIPLVLVAGAAADWSLTTRRLPSFGELLLLFRAPAFLLALPVAYGTTLTYLLGLGPRALQETMPSLPGAFCYFLGDTLREFVTCAREQPDTPWIVPFFPATSDTATNIRWIAVYWLKLTAIVLFLAGRLIGRREIPEGAPALPWRYPAAGRVATVFYLIAEFFTAAGVLLVCAFSLPYL